MKLKISFFLSIVVFMAFSCMRSHEYVWEGLMLTGNWNEDLKIEAIDMQFVRAGSTVTVEFEVDKNSDYGIIELNDGNWKLLDASGTGTNIENGLLKPAAGESTFIMSKADAEAVRLDGLLVKGSGVTIRKVIIEEGSEEAAAVHDSVNPKDKQVRKEIVLYRGSNNFNDWENGLLIDMYQCGQLKYGDEIVVDFSVNEGETYGQMHIGTSSWTDMDATDGTSTNRNSYDCYSPTTHTTTFTIAKADADEITKGFVLSGEKLTVSKVTVRLK